MSWRGIQIGNRKAVKRTPWLKRENVSAESVPRQIGLHRDTTKRCSVAFHGCGNLRSLYGATRQERLAELAMRDEV